MWLRVLVYSRCVGLRYSTTSTEPGSSRSYRSSAVHELQRILVCHIDPLQSTARIEFATGFPPLQTLVLLGELINVCSLSMSVGFTWSVQIVNSLTRRRRVSDAVCPVVDDLASRHVAPIVDLVVSNPFRNPLAPHQQPQTSDSLVDGNIEAALHIDCSPSVVI